MNRILLVISFFVPFFSFAQQSEKDSLDNEILSRAVTLSEVVIRSNMNVPDFIKRVKEDTTFYKAFKNLRVIGYSSLNNIQIFDRKNHVKASLYSKTHQSRSNNCRSMDVLEERVVGDIYDKNNEYNYYTAELYASFLFTKGSVCGETNIIGRDRFSVKHKKGLAKNKEQLKMLFFNPGSKIPGIPFIGDKINIFDAQNAKYYNYSIDEADYQGIPTYIFTVKAKEGLSSWEKNNVVIDELVTWFHANTMEVMARNWTMTYSAGVYSFDVQMEVQNTKVGSYLVPQTLRYKGNWKLWGKGSEKGAFTATLFDFKP